MAYRDISPGAVQEYWTVALVRNDRSAQEVHFGVFAQSDAREALNSGMVKCLDDEHLELRRIRAFPKEKR